MIIKVLLRSIFFLNIAIMSGCSVMKPFTIHVNPQDVDKLSEVEAVRILDDLTCKYTTVLLCRANFTNYGYEDVLDENYKISYDDLVYGLYKGCSPTTFKLLVANRNGGEIKTIAGFKIQNEQKADKIINDLVLALESLGAEYDPLTRFYKIVCR